MNEILAISDKGNGLLPMKQSEEKEIKKSVEQKNKELCNFIKNAFVISDEVSMIKSDKPLTSNIWFLAKDKERGSIGIMFKSI